MSYNGWANRNTWLVNLWFGDYFNEMAEEGESVSAAFIENHVLDYVEEQIGGFTGFIADLIDIGGIDWQELAEHYQVDSDDESD